MITIFLRTLLIYTLLTCIMRLMGKRHIGELEISELVGTLLISELASMPIDNQEIPCSFAIIPIITIATIEIVSSLVLIKFPKLKNLVSTRPSTLIEKGTLDQKELIRSRLSIEELISEFRQQGISDINEINYAVLEPNGKISVILKSQCQPPKLSDLKIKSKENGIMHILVSNGYINEYNMKKHNKDLKWLQSTASKHRCTIDDIFVLLIDDSGNTLLIKKEHKK